MSLDHLLRLADDVTSETAELLAELVRIPSVNAGPNGPGGETAVCLALKARLAEEGIDSEILAVRPERGNLLASLGEGDRPRLLLMSHLDVVPVDDGDAWRYPPFSGTIADGAVHGRGACDCKAQAAASAMALAVLKRGGARLRGRVTMVAGADEETGGRLGFGWLAAHHPRRLAADCALNEGGGHAFAVEGRQGYVLCTGEKGRLEATFRLEGRGGHAALPWAADNPLDCLGEVVRRLGDYRPALDLSHSIFDASRAMLGTAAAYLSRDAYERAGKLERGLLSAMIGASRMTITPTMASAGAKSNAIPGTATLTCDIRTLPGQGPADVERELTAILSGMEGASFSLEETAEASASPYPTNFSAAIERATAAAVGRSDLSWLPGMTVGFTDSRFVRPLGTITYGFTPQALAPEAAPEGVHGRDERMPMESLQVVLRTIVATAWEVLCT